MNRNFYLTLLGAIGCCSLFTGCATDAIEREDVSDVTPLNLRVTLPDATGVVVYPGKAGIDVLYAQAFLLDGTPATSEVTKLTVSGGQAVLRMNLPADSSTRIALWAQNSHTSVYDLSAYPTVKAAYPSTQLDNDTTLLAYYGTLVVKPDATPASELKLQPAVAQINVGTSLDDYLECAPDSAMAYFVGLPTAFNIMTGSTVKNNDAPTQISFKLSPCLACTSGYKLSIGSVEKHTDYEWLSMTYVLASSYSGQVACGVFRFCSDNELLQPIVQSSLDITQGYRTNIIASH